MPNHDTELEWRRIVVTIDDLDDWRYDWSGNVYTATGPCPVCHAPEQSGLTYAEGTYGGVGDKAGGRAAANALRDDAPLGLNPDVEVDVDCQCGSSHGEGKDGCGARWVVRIGDLS
jgi:hypothetical protein